jgi:inorganic pyrophosphatase
MPPPGIAGLPSFDEDGRLLAVVEAGRGSASKFKFDPARGVFLLHKVLPLGVAFPLDFGFVPATLGEDGDPLDVLVMADEPLPPGCVVPCRLLGVIEAEQRAAGARRAKRNDRLLAVAAASHRLEGLRELRDLAPRALDEVERFFVFYNAQEGRDFRPLRRAGVAAARRLVKAGQRAAAAMSDVDGS